MSSDVREARSRFPAPAAVGVLQHRGRRSGEPNAGRCAITASSTSGPRPVSTTCAARLRARAGRGSVAALIGADRSDVALIASVSAAAGLVAAQFGPARRGQNVVIGEREYSSNHFPWRLLANKGYEVRQVPFRNGGLEPDDVAAASTAARCWSRSAACRPRPDTAPTSRRSARSRARSVRSSSSTARSSSARCRWPSDLAAHRRAGDRRPQVPAARRSRPRLLLPLAARSRIGSCPINAGWKAGRVPFESFFGPAMDLSPTASRFDNSISWLAAIGNEAALSVFDDLRRRRHLRPEPRAGRAAPGSRSPRSAGRRSTCPRPTAAASCRYRSVTPSRRSSLAELKRRGVVCSARDGNLRLAVHFYNHEDDIDRLTSVLPDL